MNTLSTIIDRLALLEKQQGNLGTVTGILSLAVLLITGIAMTCMGAYITIYACVELVNKIFF